ncbi:MAG: hypothetical protein WA092_02140 [Minisyncoccales bacterium]
MKITKKTKLSKLIDDKKVGVILEKYDFPCISCPHARYEMESLELGNVCEMYDIDSEKLIKELNEKLNKK